MFTVSLWYRSILIYYVNVRFVTILLTVTVQVFCAHIALQLISNKLICDDL